VIAFAIHWSAMPFCQDALAAIKKGVIIIPHVGHTWRMVDRGQQHQISAPAEPIPLQVEKWLESPDGVIGFTSCRGVEVAGSNFEHVLCLLHTFETVSLEDMQNTAHSSWLPVSVHFSHELLSLAPNELAPTGMQPIWKHSSGLIGWGQVKLKPKVSDRLSMPPSPLALKALAITPPATAALFECAMRDVSLKDVTDFCPDDPGYPGYVQAFAHILSQRQLPPEWDFDITETIGLPLYDNASALSDPDRFRRFRIFTNAVGIAMGVTSQEGPSAELPPNYLLIQLIGDAYDLGDAEVLGLLAQVIPEYLDRIRDDAWFDHEIPLLHLAQLMLALLGHDPGSDIEKLAQHVIASASSQEPTTSQNFLWGCTVFNQLHDRWRYFVDLTFEPHRSNAIISSLRDALL
jgi:hypothetical protein